MKTYATVVTLTVLALTGCGESRKERSERAAREMEEQQHRYMLEAQQQRNIEKEQNLRAVEAGVRAVDVLTR